VGNKNGTVFKKFFTAPTRDFSDAATSDPAELLCPLNQVVDLLAAEHFAEKRIILVLLPQSVVFFPEPVRTVDQIT